MSFDEISIKDCKFFQLFQQVKSQVNIQVKLRTTFTELFLCSSEMVGVAFRNAIVQWQAFNFSSKRDFFHLFEIDFTC